MAVQLVEKQPVLSRAELERRELAARVYRAACRSERPKFTIPARSALPKNGVRRCGSSTRGRR